MHGALHRASEQSSSNQSPHSAVSEESESAPSTEQRFVDHSGESTSRCVTTDQATTEASTPATSLSDGTNKVDAAPSKRRRFAAVPNLGQPRSRPFVPKPVIQKTAAPQTAAVVPQLLENEDGRAKDVGLMKPPPVQRMLSAPGIQKKGL